MGGRPLLVESVSGKVAESPVFTFTISSATPEAKVRCKNCGWETHGGDVSKTFARADTHACAVLEGRR